MPETIILEQENQITTIWLNRPKARNAFNPMMVNELIDAAREASQNTDSRVVVFRGTKDQFCSGADIKWLKESGSYSAEQNQNESKRISELLKAIRDIPQATISIAEGGVYGGAIGILAVCDWVLADETCSFGFPEVHLGIVPAVIWPYVLMKVQAGKALQKALTGKSFSSREALNINLIDIIASSDLLDSQLKKLLNKLLAPSPDAQKEIKKLTSELQQYPSEKVIKKTIEVLSRLKESENGQEGLTAFIEKRKPEWK